MDDSVRRAMARFPNVPAVFGWLSLDLRGRWLLRGRLIDMPQSIAFIQRNYTSDDQGRWYFQNGPQRVFVSLDYTPWIYRLDAQNQLITHTHLQAHHIHAAYVDEDSALLLVTEHGPGVVADDTLAALIPRFHNADGYTISEDRLDQAIDQLTQGQPGPLRFSNASVQPIQRQQVPIILGYDPDPQP